MLVTVLISNVVTLNPFSENRFQNLTSGILYTYCSTIRRDGDIWIFIDQLKTGIQKIVLNLKISVIINRILN
jgi:hypothetical protein